MINDIIRYDAGKIMDYLDLSDLSGTLDDIGQLIVYLRDLSRQLVPLVDSLVPLSDNLNDTIENLAKKIEHFLKDNPLLTFGVILSIGMVGGYLLTGIIKNVLEIKRLSSNN